jgi:Autotransporter beta-domain.
VAATAGGVTTTFKGAGETSVVFGAGDSAIIEGGNVVADALSNPLVNLDLDSTLGDAIYTNGTGADQTFTGQITAEIGNNNVIINADPATVPDNIGIAAAPGTILDINTTGTGNFKVANGYVAANYVAVGGTNPTTIDSDFTIGAAAPGDSGVFADVTAGDGALSVGAAMTVTGDFTVQTGYKGNNTTSGEAAIVIDAVGVGNGNTAITIDGAVDITAGTFFDVENQTVNGNIKIIDGTGVTKADMDNLAYVGGASNAWVTDVHNSSNVVYYDTDTGYFGTYDASAMSKAYSGQPRYATRYLNALDKHSGVPIAMGMRLSDNQEITMAMGNTLNAAMMMINNPLSGIFQNNNNLHAQTESRLAKSAGDCENFGLWITPNASFRSIDGDYGRGYGDVDIKSYGVTVGFDGWINDQFRLGLFAGVNSTDLDGDFQDIDGDDFQLGVYGQAFLPQGFTLNLGLAYSWQNYDANRRVYNTQDAGFNQRIKSDFDGNTLIAAIELSKTFSLDYDMFLRPAIGYTYMGTELDSYREKSTLLSNSPYNLAQRVGETDFDQHLFRVGTDIGWATDNAAVIGRVYYVGNAGDDQPETNARFRYANANVPSFKIYGAEYDDSMANLGLTVKVAPSENSHFAIDYDALLGSNSTTHNVNLTFKYEW